jgi:hypothetical protein
MLRLRRSQRLLLRCRVFLAVAPKSGTIVPGEAVTMRQPSLGHVFLCVVWIVFGCLGCTTAILLAAQTRPEKTIPPQQPPRIALPPQRNPGIEFPQLQVQIRNFRVNPQAIQPDVEQVVTVSAAVTGIPRAVVLYRLDGARPRAITMLSDDGANGDGARGDGVYTAQVKFSEPASVIPLRLEIEQTGARLAAPPRVVSETVSLRVRAVAQRLPKVEITQLSPTQITAGATTSIRVTARVELSGFRVERAEILRDRTSLGALKSVRKETAFETFEATLQVPPLNPGSFSIVAVAYVVPAASEFATPQRVMSSAQVLRVEAVSPPPLPPPPPPPAAPSITITDVQPRQIRQGVATDVVVTAALSQGRWSIRAGQLLEQGVQQPLAALQTGGTSTTLTARFVAQRAAPGSIPLIARVEVSPTAGAAAQVLRAESSVFFLQVVPAPVTQVQDKGLVLTVPEGFSRVDTKGANILMTNGPIARGGIASQGVCLIEATRTQRAPAATRDLMASETEVQNAQIQTVRVAGRPAFRAAYREEIGPGRSLDYIAVYVESPNAIHKFFVSFLTDDAVGDRCRRSLDSVLASARITE